MRPSSHFRLTTAFLALFSLVMSMALLMRSGTMAAGTSLKGIDLSPVISPAASPTPTPASNCGSWTVVSSPNLSSQYNQLSGVAAISATNVWSIGGTNVGSANGVPRQTLIEHWDGTSWSIITNPNINGTLDGLAVVPDTNQVWTVGRTGPDNSGNSSTLIEHWDGTTWTVVSSPNLSSQYNQLSGVVAISATNVWTVGGTGPQSLIEHWNGKNWNIVPSPNPSSQYNYLSSVAAISNNDIWAVGAMGINSNGYPQQTLIEHWNGINWKVISSPNVDATLNGLGVVPGTNRVWAVGNYYTGTNQTLVEYWNGRNWKIVSSPNLNNGGSLSEVAVISAYNIWTVGDYLGANGNFYPLIEHWNGTIWSVVSNPNLSSSNSSLYGVAQIPGTNQVWAVGAYYTSIGTAPEQTLVEFYC